MMHRHLTQYLHSTVCTTQTYFYAEGKRQGCLQEQDRQQLIAPLQNVLVPSITEYWESVPILTTSCFTAASSQYINQCWKTVKFLLLHHSPPEGWSFSACPRNYHLGCPHIDLQLLPLAGLCGLLHFLSSAELTKSILQFTAP